ncbi:hypothetical protein C8E89_13938 [Mycolicibacterium moriokaense]|uniref:Uncharacterized protein n=1 Tax=Mycolicibacterium moriokaense TaxID=39691 RepID=A0A318HHT9_9MYCO|nr:hypothetical protein C8E89_13938 [Mycolicibacterium moriokaense]
MPITGAASFITGSRHDNYRGEVEDARWATRSYRVQH